MTNKTANKKINKEISTFGKILFFTTTIIGTVLLGRVFIRVLKNNSNPLVKTTKDKIKETIKEVEEIKTKVLTNVISKLKKNTNEVENSITTNNNIVVNKNLSTNKKTPISPKPETIAISATRKPETPKPETIAISATTKPETPKPETTAISATAGRVATPKPATNSKPVTITHMWTTKSATSEPVTKINPISSKTTIVSKVVNLINSIAKNLSTSKIEIQKPVALVSSMASTEQKTQAPIDKAILKQQKEIVSSNNTATTAILETIKEVNKRPKHNTSDTDKRKTVSRTRDRDNIFDDIVEPFTAEDNRRIKDKIDAKNKAKRDKEFVDFSRRARNKAREAREEREERDLLQSINKAREEREEKELVLSWHAFKEKNKRTTSWLNEAAEHSTEAIAERENEERLNAILVDIRAKAIERLKARRENEASLSGLKDTPSIVNRKDTPIFSMIPETEFTSVTAHIHRIGSCNDLSSLSDEDRARSLIEEFKSMKNNNRISDTGTTSSAVQTPVPSSPTEDTGATSSAVQTPSITQIPLTGSTSTQSRTSQEDSNHSPKESERNDSREKGIPGSESSSSSSSDGASAIPIAQTVAQPAITTSQTVAQPAIPTPREKPTPKNWFIEAGRWFGKEIKKK